MNLSNFGRVVLTSELCECRICLSPEKETGRLLKNTSKKGKRHNCGDLEIAHWNHWIFKYLCTTYSILYHYHTHENMQKKKNIQKHEQHIKQNRNDDRIVLLAGHRAHWAHKGVALLKDPSEEKFSESMARWVKTKPVPKVWMFFIFKYICIYIYMCVFVGFDLFVNGLKPRWYPFGTLKPSFWLFDPWPNDSNETLFII